MHIRYKPQVYMPEEEESASKNSGDKMKNTEMQHEQNQIKEMYEIEKFREKLREERMQRKCASQEANNKQFNDEDRKALRQRETQKLAEDLDEYKKIDEDSSEQKNKKNKQKREYIEDEFEDDVYNNNQGKKKHTSLRRVANRRMQKEASLLKG